MSLHSDETNAALHEGDAVAITDTAAAIASSSQNATTQSLSSSSLSQQQHQQQHATTKEEEEGRSAICDVLAIASASATAVRQQQQQEKQQQQQQQHTQMLLLRAQFLKEYAVHAKRQLALDPLMALYEEVIALRERCAVYEEALKRVECVIGSAVATTTTSVASSSATATATATTTVAPLPQLSSSSSVMNVINTDSAEPAATTGSSSGAPSLSTSGVNDGNSGLFCCRCREEILSLHTQSGGYETKKSSDPHTEGVAPQLPSDTSQRRGDGGEEEEEEDEKKKNKRVRTENEAHGSPSSSAGISQPMGPRHPLMSLYVEQKEAASEYSAAMLKFKEEEDGERRAALAKMASAAADTTAIV